MNLRSLAWRSVRFHFRLHLGVVWGTALATAVLIGALAVGDSVKASLRAQIAARLGHYSYRIHSGDRFFPTDLPQRLAQNQERLHPAGSPSPVGSPFLNPRTAALLLLLPGRALRMDGAAQANRINVYGVEPIGSQPADPIANPADRADLPVLKEDQVCLNVALAAQLHVQIGETIILRIHKPTALSRDAMITSRDSASVALRVQVTHILDAKHLGDLAPDASGPQPLNCFVNRSQLAHAAGLDDRANLLLLAELTSPKELPALTQLLAASLILEDAELALRTNHNLIELTTRRIFLEPAAVRAALTHPTSQELSLPPATPVLTYLVNSLRHAEALTPYSMVTAAGEPYTPAGLRDDEIVVNEWLAQDLGVKPGDTVDLAYYRADAGSQLIEQTNHFQVHSVVPIAGAQADRSLMPEFPGLAKAESTHDWDAGFELVHPIRDQDEAYWKKYRGIPKAFITLAAGQRMWANRFGDLTAIRWLGKASGGGLKTSELRLPLSHHLATHIDPAEVGLRFEPIREQALAAAQNGTGNDFGGLFLSLSFFLIVSALLLTAMLFRFSLEQRAQELGTLLALGWEPQRVRNLFFREGLILAIFGAVLGSLWGVLYGRAVLYALNTFWTDAVAGGGLIFYTHLSTLFLGGFSSVIIAGLTLWWTLRGALRRPARELLNEGLIVRRSAQTGPGRRWVRWIPWGLALASLVFAGGSWKSPDTERQESFFFAGMLLLVAGLWAVRNQLHRAPRVTLEPARSLGVFARRAPARQPARSLATIALLAVATFLIVAIAAYRLDATRDAAARSAGTGGFALYAESTLPIIQDLNTRKGQEFYALNPHQLTHTRFVSFRVHDGDEASCLNLSRAGHPRLLGVHPADLADRGAFTFTGVAPGSDRWAGWKLLQVTLPTPATNLPQIPEIPAIGDAQSIEWALNKSLGGTLEYIDERGQPFRLRLIAAVANSILQGSLLIDEAELVKRFPSSGGYRSFLIDVSATPTDRHAEVQRVSAILSRSLQDVGLEVVSTADRLARFNAVQNTYLNTFQVLGGLGLLLGSIGLGVVVLRNVLERRGELGILSAIGFSKKTLIRMILQEHTLLLGLGLSLGFGAALVAILPAIFGAAEGFPRGSVVFCLSVVFINGLVWTWLATRRALAGNLLAALRGE